MLGLMDDLAPIDPVLQHPVQRAPDNRLAAPAPAGGARPPLAADAVSFELLLQQTHRVERGVAPEDVPHGFSFAADTAQLVIVGSVAERRHSAHPHALLLRRGNLVADALAGDLALELG